MTTKEPGSAAGRAFEPADVDLLASGFPPLVATFDKTEREATAALMLRAMGPTWRAVTWAEIASQVRADLATCDGFARNERAPLPGLIVDICTNPFMRPDVTGLIEAGFARWVGEPGGSTPVEFTDAGKERLRKWVRA